MGLVVSIVNSFGPKNHTERQDLMDAGRIGLWKALQKYNRENGHLISTYAWRPIRWSIIREIKSRKFQGFSDFEINKIQRLIDLRKEGYKFHEICDILDETPSKVKNKFYKLIKRLREANAT